MAKWNGSDNLSWKCFMKLKKGCVIGSMTRFGAANLKNHQTPFLPMTMSLIRIRIGFVYMVLFVQKIETLP